MVAARFPAVGRNCDYPSGVTAPLPWGPPKKQPEAQGGSGSCVWGPASDDVQTRLSFYRTVAVATLRIPSWRPELKTNPLCVAHEMRAEETAARTGKMAFQKLT